MSGLGKSPQKMALGEWTGITILSSRRVHRRSASSSVIDEGLQAYDQVTVGIGSVSGSLSCRLSHRLLISIGAMKLSIVGFPASLPKV